MKYQPEDIRFADKLNYLFETHRKPDNNEYTHEEVYQATGIAVGTISKLRTGKTTNPGFRVIRALAAFFGVSPSYFFEEIEADLSVVEDEHQARYLDKIALRASVLSDEGRRALLGMLEQIIKLEEGFEQEGDEPD